jgi:hypothetical protein
MRLEQVLGALGQQPDIHAGLELRPDLREPRTAERPGQRLDEPGEGLHLKRLIDVDHPGGRVPAGVDRRRHTGDGVPGQDRHPEPGLADGPVYGLG